MLQETLKACGGRGNALQLAATRLRWSGRGGGEFNPLMQVSERAPDSALLAAACFKYSTHSEPGNVRENGEGQIGRRKPNIRTVAIASALTPPPLRKVRRSAWPESPPPPTHTLWYIRKEFLLCMGERLNESERERPALSSRRAM